MSVRFQVPLSIAKIICSNLPISCEFTGSCVVPIPKHEGDSFKTFWKTHSFAYYHQISHYPCLWLDPGLLKNYSVLFHSGLVQAEMLIVTVVEPLLWSLISKLDNKLSVWFESQEYAEISPWLHQSGWAGTNRKFWEKHVCLIIDVGTNALLPAKEIRRC